MSAVIHPSHVKQISPLVKKRCSVESNHPSIFADVYREDTNIIIWKRKLQNSLQNSIDEFINSNQDFRLVQAVAPDSVNEVLNKALGDVSCKKELSNNIAELVEIFCDLFELKAVGLRLTTLDRAMCPKFHFDRVPCRLVTTYHGVATEWLPHDIVDRSKLGAGSNGLTDDISGLYKDNNDIQCLQTGDVALLKGELWENNEHAGLVHRSPKVIAGENRLLLTLDFLN